jgi:hypothetical protein
MGCCEARCLNLEQDFFTVGLCFIESNQRQFDDCSSDKIALMFPKIEVDSTTLFLDQKWVLDNQRIRSELETMLLSPLHKYRAKLLENYEDQELGEHKITMIGKKYHKN